ncbi:unnamed protein product [Calicophoron daubneyi]|uniref:ubiquitinyl hydrolase 1 n=1 Tax=Calicophoron daubneyi TaxID=300641 RepID=A0AAV2T7G8_CALDB
MGQAEWLELESDPGLFTLLLEDFGVKGVQVEEIYDLSKPITEVVYGFIFLFRWDNSKKKSSRRSGRGSAGSSASLIGTNMASLSDVNDTSRSNTTTCSFASKDCAAITSGPHFDGQHSLELNSTETTQDSTLDPHFPVKEEPPEIFFAQQTVQNSCATHALLSILLNRPELELGYMLNEFHKATRHLSPQAKGLAIGSMPQLAMAHNRHAAKPTAGSSSTNQPSISPILEPCEAAAAAASAALAMVSSNCSSSCALESNSSIGSSSALINAIHLDTFHFVCYVPIGGFLYELDGLKPNPINHGPLRNPCDQYGWTEQCVDILKQRMQEQDVRYSLMAVVPDRRLALTKRMNTLNRNRKIIEDTLERITRLKEQRKRLHSCCSSVNGDVTTSTTAASPAADSLRSPFTVHACTFSQPFSNDGRDVKSEEPESKIKVPSSSSVSRDFHSELGGSASPAAQERLAYSDSDRSIQTRSTTRAASTGTLKKSVSYVSPNSRAMYDEQKTKSPTSPGTSDTSSNSLIAEIANSSEHVRKRSSGSGSTDDQANGWICEKKIRLSDHISIETNNDFATGRPGTECSAAHSSRMNKLLASIMSAESPLLTTLTETVAAAAQAVTDAFEEVNPTMVKPDGLDQMMISVERPLSPTTKVNHAAASLHRLDSTQSDGNHISRHWNKSPTLSNPQISTTPSTPQALTEDAEFPVSQFSRDCILSTELTRPLTVDTQLWYNATTEKHSKNLIPERPASVGPIRMEQSSNAKLELSEVESRPQTRALTRARVKRASCTSNQTEVSDAEKDCTWTAETRLCKDGKFSPNVCSSSPPSRSTASATSPVPFESTQDEVNGAKLKDFSDPDTLTKNYPADGLKLSPQETVTSPLASEALASKPGGILDPLRRTSKYPTRSSTRRDTLASHNLAYFRSVPTNLSNTPTNGTLTPGYSNCCTMGSIPSDAQPNSLHGSSDFGGTPSAETRYPRLSVDELLLLLHRVGEQAKICDGALKEEELKRKTYRIDDARRVHDYEPFIRAYLLALARNGLLRKLVLSALQSSVTPVSGLSSSPSTPLISTNTHTKSVAHMRDQEHSRRLSTPGDLNITETASVAENHCSTKSRRNNAPRLVENRNPHFGPLGPRRLRARKKLSVRKSEASSQKDINTQNTDVETSTSSILPAAVANDNPILDSAPRSHISLTASPVKDLPYSTEPKTSVSSTALLQVPQPSPSEINGFSKVAGSTSTGESLTPTPGLPGDPIVPPKEEVVVASTVGSIFTRYQNNVSSENVSNTNPALSPTIVSYSSCGSSSLSPQSSTSSRSTHVRPRASGPSSKRMPSAEALISKKSLRPRVTNSKQVDSSPTIEEKNPSSRNRSSVRRGIFTSLVNELESSVACKPDNEPNPFSSTFSQRFRKRRLC